MTGFVGRWLYWLDGRFPFLHVRRGRRVVKPAEHVDEQQEVAGRDAGGDDEANDEAENEAHERALRGVVALLLTAAAIFIAAAASVGIQ